MSVYTPVSESQLAAWLTNYSVGALAAHEPVAAGIENTNYFVTTSQGRYVLTLFERLPATELPFYLELMAHLARHGIPCPAPVADLADRFLGSLNGKPAALVTRLAGASIDEPSAADCAELGALLARMHLAGRSYGAFLENPRGSKWWRSAARQAAPFLAPPHAALLEAELQFQAQQRFADLPRGALHGDLFRDNALFERGRITGVIDFYFAGVDCLIYDLAVCVNDWCLVDLARDRRLDETRVRALLGAYRALRPLQRAERDSWPAMLRAAALRFWLSRLLDMHLPRAGELVTMHDPDHFRDILALHAAAGSQPPWSD